MRSQASLPGRATTTKDPSERTTADSGSWDQEPAVQSSDCSVISGGGFGLGSGLRAHREGHVRRHRVVELDADGVLADQIVINEDALVRIPSHLSFEQAATLPCAAVTAWNAALVRGRLRAGDTLVTLGTGGVSLFAAQLGLLTGARVVSTTGSDDKAERLRAMGVHAVVNYRSTPHWDTRVREITSGRGADVVVEVGGAGSLSKSISAVRYGGHISVVGTLAGGGTIDPATFFAKRASVCGIQVGSRDMFEAMNRALEVAALEPLIDRVFDFEHVRDAYEHLASGQHFGKTVIRVS